MIPRLFQSFLICIIIASLLVSASYQSYAYDPSLHIYATTLAQSGVINIRDSAEAYDLDRPIQRGEALKISLNIAKAKVQKCTGTVFSDVSESLGDICSYIESAAQAGVISTANREFRPSDPITRAELIKVFLRSRNISPFEGSFGFLDVPESLGVLKGYIQAGAKLGCVNRGNNYFPYQSASRGEAFKIASCAMSIEQGTIEKYNQDIVSGIPFVNNTAQANLISTSSLFPTTIISPLAYSLGSLPGTDGNIRSNGSLTISGNTLLGGDLTVIGNTTLSTFFAQTGTITHLVTSNTLISSGNTLTSNIGGSVGTGDIITRHTLSTTGSDIISDTNGVQATINLDNAIISSISTNTGVTAALVSSLSGETLHLADLSVTGTGIISSIVASLANIADLITDTLTATTATITDLVATTFHTTTATIDQLLGTDLTMTGQTILANTTISGSLDLSDASIILPSSIVDNGLSLGGDGRIELGGALHQDTSLILSGNILNIDQSAPNSLFKVQGESGYALASSFDTREMMRFEHYANDGFSITSYENGPLSSDSHGVFLNFGSNLSSPIGSPTNAYIYNDSLDGSIGMGRFAGGDITFHGDGSFGIQGSNGTIDTESGLSISNGMGGGSSLKIVNNDDGDLLLQGRGDIRLNLVDATRSIVFPTFLSTRDDSIGFDPVNFLYTDSTGNLLSAPTDVLLNRLTASNGLTKSGSVFQLGGTLSENTNIELRGNTLTFDIANSSSLVVQSNRESYIDLVTTDGGSTDVNSGLNFWDSGKTNQLANITTHSDASLDTDIAFGVYSPTYGYNTPLQINSGRIGINTNSPEGLIYTYNNPILNRPLGFFAIQGDPTMNVGTLGLGEGSLASGIGNSGRGELWINQDGGSIWNRAITTADGDLFWNTTGNAGVNPTNNFLGTTDSNDLVIKTNNIERMRILGTGNIGIGTNNPLTKFQVSGTTGDTAIRVYDSSLGFGDVGFETYSTAGQEMKIGHWSSAVQFYSMRRRMDIGAVGAGMSLNLYGGGSSRMTVTGTGDVGIGTASPSAKFQVTKSFASGSTIVRFGHNLAASDFTMVAGSTSDFTDYNFGNLFKIQRLGTGIPNISASNNLTISSQTAGGYLLIKDPANSGTIGIQSLSGVPGNFGTYNSAGAILNIGNIFGGSFANTQQTVFKNSSNVTIENTALKTANFDALTLSNTATATAANINKVGIRIESTGTLSGLGSSNVGLSVNVAGAPTNYAAIFSGGSVGINTTAPTARLDVNGDGRFITRTVPYYGLKVQDYTDTTGMYLGSVSAFNMRYIAGQSYYNNSSNWRSDSTTSSIMNLSSGNIGFYTNAGLTTGVDFTPTERMRITSAGRVGIGVINPGNTFEINSTLTGATGLRFTQINSTSATGSASNGKVLTLNSSGDMVLTDDLTGTAGWSLTGNSGTNSGTNFIGTTDAQPLIFRTSGVEQMRIASDGKIGIGSTSIASVDAMHIKKAGSFRLNLESTSAGSYAGVVSTSPSASWFSGLIGSTYQMYDNFTGNPRLVLDSSGRVGVSTSTTLGAQFEVEKTSINNPTARFATVSNLAYTNEIELRRANGTSLTPTIASPNEVLGRFVAQGHTGGGYATAGIISMDINGTPTATSMPGVIRFSTTASGTTSPTERLRINAAGNVGVGTTGPTALLSVNGAANNTTGTWGVFSDIRSKENIIDYNRGLDDLMRLRPVTFNYKPEFGMGANTHIGFVAQELQSVSPETVTNLGTVHGIDNFLENNQEGLLQMTIKAVQELNRNKTDTGAVQVLSGSLSALSGSLASQSLALSQMQLLLNSFTANSGSMSPINTTVVNNYTSTGMIFQMSGTGQVAIDTLTAVRAESPRSALSYITDMIAQAFEVVRDFVVLQITAVRGYFDEIFAQSITTKTTLTETLCIGTETNKTCLTKSQIDSILLLLTPEPPVSSGSTPPSGDSGGGSGSVDPSSGSGTQDNSQDTSGSGTTGSGVTQIEGCMDATATNYSPLATHDDGTCTYEVTP